MKFARRHQVPWNKKTPHQPLNCTIYTLVFTPWSSEQPSIWFAGGLPARNHSGQMPFHFVEPLHVPSECSLHPLALIPKPQHMHFALLSCFYLTAFVRIIKASSTWVLICSSSVTVFLLAVLQHGQQTRSRPILLFPTSLSGSQTRRVLSAILSANPDY